MNQKIKLLAHLIERGALTFHLNGRVLRSGRESPYYLNTGGLYTGGDLVNLGNAYAGAVLNLGQNTPPDVVFGPAYKAIPIAAAISIALAHQGHPAVAYASARKELKTHGDTGLGLGCVNLAGREIVIVDDVATTGGSILAAAEYIRAQKGHVKGVVVLFDRMERPSNDATLTATAMLATNLGAPVRSAICLRDLIEGVKSGDLRAPEGILERIEQYAEQYCILE